MKLTLSQQELEQAVRRYVTGMINLQPGTDITIEFTAGRGEKGTTAEVDINYLDVAALPAAIPAGPIPRAAQEQVADTQGPAALAASQDKAPADKPSEPTADPKEDAPAAATRKTTGKSIFDKNKAKEDAVVDAPATPAANDDAADPEAAPATGERKTLFGS
jgi:hypothetical protein